MQPKDVVRSFIDRYQTGADDRALEELMHPDVVDYSRPPGVAPGANTPAAANMKPSWLMVE